MAWEEKKLGDVFDKGSSNISINKINEDTGKYPLYGAKGLIKTVSFYHQDKDYIAIIKDGAGVGRLSMHKAYSSIIGTLQYLIPKYFLDLKFAYYILHSVDFNKYLQGSTIPHIYFKDYKNEQLLIPPLPEQKRIVAILDKTFEKLSKAKENAEKNLKNAKEVFESYLLRIFENKGEDWEENNLEDISDVEYGFTGKSKKEGEYRYVRITDIDDNGLLISQNKLYLEKSKDADKFIINNKDLLMARTGATFAKVLFFEEFEKSVFASYLIRINFKSNIQNKLYWYFTKSKLYWDQANNLASGSAQPHFNGAAVKKVIFSYPKSSEEQKKIVSKFDSLSEQTKKLESIYIQKLADLEELKQSILQKAFKGELSKVAV